MLFAELSPLHVVDECIKALIVEPRRLISARASGSLNMRGLGLPIGAWGDGTHLDKAKAHGAQGVDAPGILSSPAAIPT